MNKLIKKIKINIPNNSYTITLGRHLLKNVDKYFDVNRKILIVTDDNIPSKYIKSVKSKIKDCHVLVIKNGEKNKNFANYQKILESLIKYSFTRKDAVIAIGGEVNNGLITKLNAGVLRIQGITDFNSNYLETKATLYNLSYACIREIDV